MISASKRKPRGGSGRNHDQIALTELLKLQKSGQFPDEPVRIKNKETKLEETEVSLALGGAITGFFKIH